MMTLHFHVELNRCSWFKFMQKTIPIASLDLVAQFALLKQSVHALTSVLPCAQIWIKACVVSKVNLHTE